MYQLQGQGYYRGQRSNLFSLDFHDCQGQTEKLIGIHSLKLQDMLTMNLVNKINSIVIY